MASRFGPIVFSGWIPTTVGTPVALAFSLRWVMDMAQPVAASGPYSRISKLDTTNPTLLQNNNTHTHISGRSLASCFYFIAYYISFLSFLDNNLMSILDRTESLSWIASMVTYCKNISLEFTTHVAPYPIYQLPIDPITIGAKWWWPK